MKNHQSYDAPLGRDLIRIEYSPHGRGAGWVYCYYFPYVRDLRIRLGYKSWPCKIGKDDDGEDARDRIREQFRSVGVFDAPSVGFLAKTTDPKSLEDSIHAWLDKRNRRINERGSGLGTEWFETNLLEVRRAYREYMWPGWRNLPWRLINAVLMHSK